MSAICGYVGPADPSVLDLMLAPVSYRGDRSTIASMSGMGFGFRFWSGRKGKSDAIVRAGDTLGVMSGSFAPATADPAASLGTLLEDAARLATLDGNFAAAHWDGARPRLTLARDPFGVRALYYVQHALARMAHRLRRHGLARHARPVLHFSVGRDVVIDAMSTFKVSCPRKQSGGSRPTNL